MYVREKWYNSNLNSIVVISLCLICSSNIIIYMYYLKQQRIMTGKVYKKTILLLSLFLPLRLIENYFTSEKKEKLS